MLCYDYQQSLFLDISDINDLSCLSERITLNFQISIQCCVMNTDIMALYLLEQSYNNLYYTLEKLFFWIIIIIFPWYELYKIVRTSVICCSTRMLKVCSDQPTTAGSCCFGFFNASFELTRVHSCNIFRSGSSYAKNLPKFNGKEIMVASPSAALSFFLQNLERILANCSQLYINCLAISLFIEICSKRAFKVVAQQCLIVILSFLPVLSTFLLSSVFDSLIV